MSVTEAFLSTGTLLAWAERFFSAGEWKNMNNGGPSAEDYRTHLDKLWWGDIKKKQQPCSKPSRVPGHPCCSASAGRAVSQQPTKHCGCPRGAPSRPAADQFGDARRQKRVTNVFGCVTTSILLSSYLAHQSTAPIKNNPVNNLGPIIHRMYGEALKSLEEENCSKKKKKSLLLICMY